MELNEFDTSQLSREEIEESTPMTEQNHKNILKLFEKKVMIEKENEQQNFTICVVNPFKYALVAAACCVLLAGFGLAMPRLLSETPVEVANSTSTTSGVSETAANTASTMTTVSETAVSTANTTTTSVSEVAANPPSSMTTASETAANPPSSMTTVSETTANTASTMTTASETAANPPSSMTTASETTANPPSTTTAVSITHTMSIITAVQPVTPPQEPALCKLCNGRPVYCAGGLYDKLSDVGVKPYFSPAWLGMQSWYEVAANKGIISEITLFNGQTMLITGESSGWRLKQGDELVLLFDIDLSDMTHSDQSGERAAIGYYDGESFVELYGGKIKDSLVVYFTAPRDAEYLFYLTNYCASAQNYREIKVF